MSTVTLIQKDSSPAYALNTGTAVFGCIIYFLAPALYVGIEFYVSLEYSPSYSYKRNYTSQLGIPYENVELNTGRTAFSARAHLMNYMFVANGLLFLIGQRLLLGVFDKTPRLATTRTLLAIGYCIGFIMIAAVPGGSREEEAGLGVIHGIGALLVILLGPVNSFLTGMVAPKWGLHKITSLACGSVGFFSGIYFFSTLGRIPDPGLSQRLSLYSTQLWMFFTADMLMGEISKVMKAMEREEERAMVKQE